MGWMGCSHHYSPGLSDSCLPDMQGMVKELTAKEAKLSNGEVIPFGVCVWSTGVGPSTFINNLPFAKTAKGRLAVDKYLRVLEKGAESNEGHPEEVCQCLEVF